MESEKFGPYLNIDKFLGKAKNRINLVGVELEGGWFRLIEGRVPDRDGSVHFNLPTDNRELAMKVKYPGEIPLPPHSVKEYPAVMKLYYPHYVNETCGMHVHMSTTKAFAYSRLMVNKPYSYPGTVIEYVKRWAHAEKLPANHPLWPRLEGKSEYCQHLFHAGDQIKDDKKDFEHFRKGHRYTVISYCWGRYRTLECRLLPMMANADLGVRAVQNIIDITNAFLAASREKETRKKSLVIDHEDDDYVEERKSYV